MRGMRVSAGGIQLIDNSGIKDWECKAISTYFGIKGDGTEHHKMKTRIQKEV